MLSKLYLILLVFAVYQLPAFGQENRAAAATRFSSPTDKVSDAEIELREVDLGFMTLCIPKRLKEQEVKCRDGGCWEFADGEIRLSIDHSWYAGRPTFEREHPTYSEEQTVVDGFRAIFWSFKEEPPFQFVNGAIYGIEKGGNIGLGIYLSSKERPSKELAKLVFQSAKFTKQDKSTPK